jgi:DNA polymerase III delta prime subunit
MEVVFLKAKQRLIKEISLEGKKPYPLVKNFTSHHHKFDKTEEGFDEFFSLLKQYAKQGAALHKGLLKRKLKNESRAMLTDRAAQTDLLVLDLDGIEFPISSNKSTLSEFDIQTIAEQFVTYLPPEFQDVSYIAQASASLGLKGNKVSMHLFFLLKYPVYPKVLKEWFRTLNYEIDFLANQLNLSANGQSIAYPLDVSLADNSKLIYIAPPKFVGLQDPIAGDRFVCITRGEPTVDIVPLLKDVNPEKVHNLGVQIKDGLRKKAGLTKKAERITTVNVGGEAQEVLQNPDRMTIEVCRVSEPYVNCNINGGDSGAYYFILTNPHYMYNFKGEPVFEIQKADPEFYKSIFDTFADEMEGGKDARPVILRDYYTDTFYNGVFDKGKEQFTDDFPLTPTQKGSLEGFMRTHNRPMPDFVPDAQVVFDPSSGKGIQMDTAPYYVNLFRKTQYMLAAEQELPEVKYGESENFKKYVPLSYKLIQQILGGGVTETEHFVNWLAYIYQKKQKTMTAWILTGVPGTGKGLFVHKILKPLFGESQVPMRSLENIEEQFNLYMRMALFLVVDEFRMGDSGNIGRMADKLKHQITEPTLTVRAMRANQVELPSYCNFLFLTNRADAVKIEDGDRRYNVAPRQERKLEKTFPELLTRLEDLDKELYLFAGLLEKFQVDERMAHTALDNDAKRDMKLVSMSVLEEFANAIKQNNLEYFVEILDIPLTNTFDAGGISTSQRYIKNWIATEGEETIIPMQHLKVVYDVLTDNKKVLSIRDFTKAMSRLSITTTRKRMGEGENKSAPRGVLITWVLDKEVKESVLNEHFDKKDMELTRNTATH